MRTFTSPLFAATMLYGRMLFACATSSDSNLRPIRRLIAKTVLNGFVIACRFAICPTSRSLSSVNPTTDGVVRLPFRSEFASDQALDREDGVERIRDRLPLRDLSDQPLVVLGEPDDRRRRAAPFQI